jgi:hypothetical protein
VRENLEQLRAGKMTHRAGVAGLSLSQLGIDFVVGQVDDHRAGNHRCDDLFAIEKYGFAVGLKVKEASVSSSFGRMMIMGFFPE